MDYTRCMVCGKHEDDSAGGKWCLQSPTCWERAGVKPVPTNQPFVSHAPAIEFIYKGVTG